MISERNEFMTYFPDLIFFFDKIFPANVEKKPCDITPQFFMAWIYTKLEGKNVDNFLFTRLREQVARHDRTLFNPGCWYDYTSKEIEQRLQIKLASYVIYAHSALTNIFPQNLTIPVSLDSKTTQSWAIGSLLIALLQRTEKIPSELLALSASTANPVLIKLFPNEEKIKPGCKASNMSIQFTLKEVLDMYVRYQVAIQDVSSESDNSVKKSLALAMMRPEFMQVESFYSDLIRQQPEFGDILLLDYEESRGPRLRAYVQVDDRERIFELEIAPNPAEQLDCRLLSDISYGYLDFTDKGTQKSLCQKINCEVKSNTLYKGNNLTFQWDPYKITSSPAIPRKNNTPGM